MIAALYVERGGPYFDRVDVDPWDKERDARSYDGPWPIVAHPPCGPWGRLKHLYRGDEHELAPLAVKQVQKWGGVLEHPAWSSLWARCRLPMPGELFPDEHGGYSIEVCQVDWGHVARKRTWLYLVGVPRSALSFPPPGTPTHWIGGFRYSEGRESKTYRSTGSAVPPGIKVCSAQQRRRTPGAFADWLLNLARQSDLSRCSRTSRSTSDDIVIPFASQ